MNDDLRDAGTLAAGLEEQKALYLALEALSLRQRDLLAAEDPADLERLLAEKQAVLDRAGALEAGLAGPRDRWRDVRERLAPERRAAIERLIDDVAAVLQRLLALESAGRAVLESRRSETAAAIEAGRRRRLLPAAYRAPGAKPEAPRFVDDNR